MPEFARQAIALKLSKLKKLKIDAIIVLRYLLSQSSAMRNKSSTMKVGKLHSSILATGVMRRGISWKNFLDPAFVIGSVEIVRNGKLEALHFHFQKI